jgi:hypothetical protein
MKDVAAIAIKSQLKMAIVADCAKNGSGSLSDNRWIVEIEVRV